MKVYQAVVTYKLHSCYKKRTDIKKINVSSLYKT